MMERLSLFDSNLNSVIESDLTEKDIRFIVADCEPLNVNVYIFQGEEVSTKSDLLKEMFVRCEFPGWFGFNWDALKDCLEDFSFSDAKGHFFIFKNHEIMKSKSMDDYFILINILEEACESWKKDRVLFKILLS